MRIFTFQSNIIKDVLENRCVLSYLDRVYNKNFYSKCFDIININNTKYSPFYGYFRFNDDGLTIIDFIESFDSILYNHSDIVDSGFLYELEIPEYEVINIKEFSNFCTTDYEIKNVIKDNIINNLNLLKCYTGPIEVVFRNIKREYIVSVKRFERYNYTSYKILTCFCNNYMKPLWKDNFIIDNNKVTYDIHGNYIHNLDIVDNIQSVSNDILLINMLNGGVCNNIINLYFDVYFKGLRRNTIIELVRSNFPYITLSEFKFNYYCKYKGIIDMYR